MKKYTKEITALLTLVTAGVGVVGGSAVHAVDEDTPTAGMMVVSETEDFTPLMGDVMVETSCTQETEMTHIMGEAISITTDTSVTTLPVTKITPMMGTYVNTDTTTTPPPVTTLPVTEITPMMGTFVNTDTTTTPPPVTTLPVTEITPMMGTFVNTDTTTTPPPVTTLPVTEITPMMGTFVNTDTTTTPPPVSETTPRKTPAERGRGDINGDGETDLSDLIRLSQYLLKDIKLDEQALIEADMTKDNMVDITDLPAMKMRIMIPERTDIPDDGEPGTVTDDSFATIRLDHEPYKTEYKTGESLDLSGTVISACGHSSNGPTWDIFSHNVTLDDTMVNVDASEFNNQVPGTYVITINCKEAPCSTSFTVTVTEPDTDIIATVTEPVTDGASAQIHLDHEPYKTVYKTGEALDLSGTVISACGHSPQGPTWDIFSHHVTLNDTTIHVDASSFNNQVPGTYTITLSYKNLCSTSFTVTVTE